MCASSGGRASRKHVIERSPNFPNPALPPSSIVGKEVDVIEGHRCTLIHKQRPPESTTTTASRTADSLKVLECHIAQVQRTRIHKVAIPTAAIDDAAASVQRIRSRQ